MKRRTNCREDGDRSLQGLSISFLVESRLTKLSRSSPQTSAVGSNRDRSRIFEEVMVHDIDYGSSGDAWCMFKHLLVL